MIKASLRCIVVLVTLELTTIFVRVASYPNDRNVSAATNREGELDEGVSSTQYEADSRRRPNIIRRNLFMARHEAVDARRQRWGHVEVRPGAQLFFWLHVARAPSRAARPLVLWLQGGPGVAASGFGNFHAVGLLDEKLRPRNASWVHDVNVLFVDSPVGTGFSYVEDESLLADTNHQIANDLVIFTKKFMEMFPEFKVTPFYIFSQDYGSKMAAEFALQLFRAHEERTIRINLRGIAMIAPWISPLDSVESWTPYLVYQGLVGERGAARVAAAARAVSGAVRRGAWAEAAALWSAAEWTVLLETAGVDMRNVHTRVSSRFTRLLYDIRSSSLGNHYTRPEGKAHQRYVRGQQFVNSEEMSNTSSIKIGFETKDDVRKLNISTEEKSIKDPLSINIKHEVPSEKDNRKDPTSPPMDIALLIQQMISLPKQASEEKHETSLPANASPKWNVPMAAKRDENPWVLNADELISGKSPGVGSVEEAKKPRPTNMGRGMLAKQDNLAKLMNEVVAPRLGLRLPRGWRWHVVSNDVVDALAEDFMKPAVETVELLLNETNLQVTVVSAQLDVYAHPQASARWLRALRWEGAAQWSAAPRRALPFAGLVAGDRKSFANLSAFSVRRVGQMMIMENPELGRELLRRVTKFDQEEIFDLASDLL